MGGNPFDLIFIRPITNILILLYHFFEWANFPFPLFWAIIFLTVISRLLLWPFTAAQLRHMRKIHELRPKLAKLKEIHGHDKIRHRQEMIKLYKEHNISPTAGCLPNLAQLPFLIAIYQVLFRVLSNGGGIEGINQLLYHPALYLKTPLNTSFFGWNLALRPVDLVKESVWVVIIPLLTGVFQFLWSKMAASAPLPKQTAQAVKVNKAKQAEPEKVDTDQMAEMVQSQMIYLMPVMVAFFAFQFPLGLAIYWNTFTIIGAIQQYWLVGWGQLANWKLPFKR